MAQKEWVRQIFQLVCVVDNVSETLENWKRDVEFDQNSISCGTSDVAKYAEFDFGGVDILDGGYVCEVNSNAHIINIMKSTGVDIAPMIFEHILERIK